MAIAGVRCSSSTKPVTTIVYYLFASDSDVSDAFRIAREGVNITTRGTACLYGGGREYWINRDEAQAVEVGEFTCYLRQREPHVVWTDTEKRMLMHARRDTGTAADIMSWWETREAEPGG